MADGILYHNPRCSKSRQALAILKASGLEPQIVEYLKTPPDAVTLQRLLGQLGLKAKDVLRAKEAVAAGIDPDASEGVLIAGLAAHPEALERPIFVRKGKAVLGRPPEKVLEIL
ncbi:MAG: arsenate reductase (glutaredoxin) [Ferrovibrio sp.]|uniref:arsenate reductase (glutaredoxin) n=1 Tax=Ferrovibrio sp. TaxID=1917215 RepID=UPI00260B7DBF|nr:arsenate reductase (glutaredoxin) [Ferrovibrio sp.]MCW0233616.1 arsenate reductase (glutaredoxin) [Ferrovibrio sp.]